MKARLVIAEPTPEHMADVVGFWDDETVAQIVEQHGNRGCCLFRDDVTGPGRGTTVALFEPEPLGG